MIYLLPVSTTVMERDTVIPVLIKNIDEACSERSPEPGKKPSD